MLSQLGYTMLSNGQTYQQYSIRAVFKNFPSEAWLMDMYPVQQLLTIDTLPKLTADFSGVHLHKMRFSAELFRDVFGVKQLYYWYQDELLICSNDLLSVLACLPKTPAPNEAVIHKYLNLSDTADFIEEDTFFEGIKRVLPGQKVRFSMQGVEKQFFWKPPEVTQNSEETGTFKTAFINSVQFKLNQNSHVAANLSGGLDSSSICSMISQKTSANLNGIFFDTGLESASESNYAHAVSVENDFDLHKVKSNDDLLKDIRYMTAVTGQPERMVVPSTIFLPIFEKTKALKAPLLFSGHGGDNIIESGRAWLDHLFKKRNFKRLKAELRKQWQLKSKVEDFEIYFIEQLTPYLKGNALLKATQLFLIPEVDKSKAFHFIKSKLNQKGKLSPTLILKTRSSKKYNELKREIPKGKTGRIMESCLSGLSIQSLETLDAIGAQKQITSVYPFLSKETLLSSASVKDELNFDDARLRGLLRDAMSGILPDIIRDRTDKAAFTDYSYECFNRLHEQTLTSFPNDHQLWSFVDYSSFKSLCEYTFKSEIPLNKKSKAIIQCSRVLYLGIWLNEFYSS
ncbi:asparagine synthase-related protein [Jiulongibacter sediminis]|uniref:asparagine synthase (glutamine-hydrolyzing) n=1 Tax=Jiulongibacter sediminis TaxID=1605367 RepID=A0A0N8H9C8_9BACT|nr:asparagine synthase-related protein [Jiulongibacter sediminis]KPM47012.1 hypothetical protein AFM12_17440 [Jiulongibacter sediminis]TBX22354.1 hypothetical protein TK44_17445 [Jiulongibacter sediminis]